MESHRVTLVILLVVLAMLLFVYISTSTSLLTAIDVNLTGIAPDWNKRWENFVAIQVNSSVKEVKVTLNMGKHRMQDCSQSIFLTDGTEVLEYELAEEFHIDDLCSEAVVKWKNKIYKEKPEEPIETKTYYLYFGPLLQVPVITPVTIIEEGGIPVIVNVQGITEEFSGKVTVFVGVPVVTDVNGEVIESNTSLSQEDVVVWTTDSEGDILPEGAYNAEIDIPDFAINLKNVIIPPETKTILHFDQPLIDISSPENTSWKRLFAIDIPLEFNSGKMETVAVGTQLWKCVDWNFTNRSCDGEWTFEDELTAGEDYKIKLKPGDPAWGEAVENITNETNVTNETLVVNFTIGETARIEGYIKTVMVSSNLTSEQDNGKVYFMVRPIENPENEIAVMVFPLKTYTFGERSLSNMEVFSLANLFHKNNYIEADVVRIEPQLIPWIGFGFYQSQEGFTMYPDSYTNETFEIVDIVSFTSSD